MLNKTSVRTIAELDVEGLIEAEKGYGDSWKKRGGIGAFMMLARKWDRIENQAKQCGWDIFEAVKKHPGKEGVLDDIRDLRRYLILVEEHCIQPGEIQYTEREDAIKSYNYDKAE